MLPALCFNKLSCLITVVILSRCIKISYQQRQPFDEFDQFGVKQQYHGNLQSGLNNNNWLHPGQELVFVTTTSTSRPATDSVVYVNNQPAVPTMVPFITSATTLPPDFLQCFSKCPTTSEFNPICASNRELYTNEQKFNCARYCGADIQIVRRGSCEGLFPIARG